MFGANGHKKVVVEIVELLDLTIVGIIDNAPVSHDLFGYPVLSNIQIIAMSFLFLSVIMVFERI